MTALTNKNYLVSAYTLSKVLAALDRHQTSEDYNNDDVIEAYELLFAEIKGQA